VASPPPPTTTRAAASRLTDHYSDIIIIPWTTCCAAAKPAVFVGSSRRDLKAFPDEVRQEIGQALFEVQLGLHPKAAKPLKGFGSGVLEIRDNHDGDTYRAVYTVRF
jgi:phage-related protein